jgi:RNA-directed DNA polymerase
MKRKGNLITQIASFDNLIMAYKKAARGKRNRSYVKRFYLKLEENLFAIQSELLSGNYNWGEYNVFEVTDSKKRIIHAPQFRDRVTQHAINNILEPIFDTTFISTSFACRKQKGTLAGVIAYEKAIKNSGTKYVLKCDIKKYFDSINHTILFTLLNKKIKDKILLKVLSSLIFNGKNAGIPIGNLCSQLFANIYLNQLDMFIKHKLPSPNGEGLGVRHYLRYMDDFVLFAESKENLQQLRIKIEHFLIEELQLVLHPNKQHILIVGNGVTWLGYRVYPNKYKRIANRNVVRFRNRLKQLNLRYVKKEITLPEAQQIIASWFALSKHANAFHLSKNLFSENFLHSDIASLARYMMCKQMVVVNKRNNKVLRFLNT